MRVNAAAGSENSRSRLTTGMPASVACRATAVSWAPSYGSMTIAFGFCWISDWIAAICAGASLPGSTGTSLTSGYLAACALALLVIAAIQPWSAAGAVNPIVTVLPAWALLPPDTLVWPLLSLELSLDVQPGSRTPAPRADPPSRNPRREVDMLASTVELRLASQVREPE